MGDWQGQSEELFMFHVVKAGKGDGGTSIGLTNQKQPEALRRAKKSPMKQSRTTGRLAPGDEQSNMPKILDNEGDRQRPGINAIFIRAIQQAEKSLLNCETIGEVGRLQRDGVSESDHS
jgi:hypothetical protein